ncbi:MAG TPA: DUF5916 domain-containing protein [Thermoanaerobaculia bacterium]|nr:DUF5916 domain-containing protein [Thermoanaerobaculia bacterium]
MAEIPFRAAFVLFAFCLAAATASSAQETGALQPRNHFDVRPASSQIRVDGSLDEAAWAEATVIPLTHEWFPSDNTKPPVDTECLVTFDSANLYVAFRAHDPNPSQIRAHLADRDTSFLDDTVGFYIDTFNDQRRAFEFRVNPLGVQMEATVSDIDATEDWSWNAIWDSAGRITPEGYVVELAVPFRQLRFPRTEETQTWGFLASRDYPRSVLHQLRSTRNNRSQDCTVCQFDTLTGFRRIETGYNLETVPTVTAGRTDSRLRLTSPLEAGDEDVEAGLSARWGITPNVTLNATLNPDFSQVEADAAELNVNERFALFFPEKRPFFLEGADFFETPLDAVFTRTVADPSFGVKLTGKEGRNAFGIFLAEDRLNNLLLPSAEGSGFAFLNQDVRSGVVRYRRDIGTISSLGVLYAGRQADDYSNQVYGLDGSLRLTASDTFRFQALNSETEYPSPALLGDSQPLRPFGGAAYTAAYNHGTRNWAWRAAYDRRDAGFRADSGFIPQVDFQEYTGVVQRTFWGKPGGWYSRFTVNVNSSHKEDLDGRLLDEDANLALQYEGPLQSVVRVRILPNRESFLGVTYSNYRHDLLVAVRPRGDFYLELFVRGGEVIDVVNARQADFAQVQPRVEFKLGRSVSGELQHVWQEFLVHGDRFLRANLTQTTVRYHLNLRTFFRAILQYRDVDRDLALHNPGLGLEPQDERLFSQFLFSYKLNPQTVLLAGYSDTREATSVVDELTQRNRNFFLKLGYAVLW